MRSRSKSGAGFRKSIAYGIPSLIAELDGVHFVAQRLIDGFAHLRDYARAQLIGQILMLDQIAALAGIVNHWKNVSFSEREAAHVLLEIYIFLKRHAVRPGAVISREKFFADCGPCKRVSSHRLSKVSGKRGAQRNPADCPS